MLRKLYLPGKRFVNLENAEGNTIKLCLTDDTASDELVAKVTSDEYASRITFRGVFKPVEKEVTNEWKNSNYQATVDMFKTPEVNKETANVLVKKFSEKKVEYGYNTKDADTDITKDDWDSILAELNPWFEEYLLSLDTKETDGPFTEYLKANLYFEYSGVFECADGCPIYICNISDGKGWKVLNSVNVDSYFDAYQKAYYSKSDERILNKGDILETSELKDGTFYRLGRNVQFVLQANTQDCDIVLWYITYDGEVVKKYVVWNLWSEKNLIIKA